MLKNFFKSFGGKIKQVKKKKNGNAKLSLILTGFKVAVNALRHLLTFSFLYYIPYVQLFYGRGFLTVFKIFLGGIFFETLPRPFYALLQ